MLGINQRPQRSANLVRQHCYSSDTEFTDALVENATTNAFRTFESLASLLYTFIITKGKYFYYL